MRRKFFSIFVSCLLIVILTGCEAFVRKFTRKPKEQKKEEMVLAPEEYKDKTTPEQRYRQYFLFWESWQEELTTSFLEHRSLQKKVDCMEQAIKNLQEMRKLIANEAKQKSLDKYLQQSIRLRDMIADDIYGRNDDENRERGESIRRTVSRYFDYPAVKNFVK
ncbi:MAG: hypothetical protein PHH69_00520 [Candidatus Omnitrophica bacterium]|nr:hypothetical protein [Candidatus Omnitrophota bacterium]MDD5610012.1 hypothetical protein [Candidatus Omnitrophota bacterium]